MSVNPFEAANAEAAALAVRTGRRLVSVVARLDRSDDTLVRCGEANGTCGGMLAHIDRHVGPDGDLPTGVVRGYLRLAVGFHRLPDGTHGLGRRSAERLRRDRAAVGSGELTGAQAARRAARRARALVIDGADYGFEASTYVDPNAEVRCPACKHLNWLDPQVLRLDDPTATLCGSPSVVDLW